MSSRSRSSAPCAACKQPRRRCSEDCIIPYFPSTGPEKFAALHRVFGASNASKMLQDIPAEFREDAVYSMVYESNARLRDPVYGSVAFIAALQLQASQLQLESANASSENIKLRAQLSELVSLLAYINTPYC